MISVLEEPAVTAVGTLMNLFLLHGKEVVGTSFNLNLVTFTEAIKAGLTRFFVARKPDGEAVGYAYVNVYRDAMEADKISADCQAIYVLPEYRGRVTIKLIKTMELVLQSSKVNKIYMHIPYSNKRAADMFAKLGYRYTEYTLDKEL